MTARVWLKILLIVLVIALPLLGVQFLLQKQSVELVFDFAQKMNRPDLLDSHLTALKRLASFDRQHQEKYKEEFQRTIESKLALQDLLLLKQSVVSSIIGQTLKLALVLLALCLVLSFFVSRNLVSQFQLLVRENLRHARRLELLNAIETWQKFARMLVHELRAPLTPIKLISGDMVDKYRSLPEEGFSRYLMQGSALIGEQVGTVEKMIENFLKFAKLPSVQVRPVLLTEVVESFVRNYSACDPLQVELRYVAGPHSSSESRGLDPALLGNLFFNLVKNAAEANPDRKVVVTFQVTEDQRGASVLIHNEGNLIPPALAARIFEPYVTSKEKEGNLNLGLGLTISKKIALDHGGDLLLRHNDDKHGVVFSLELPRTEGKA